MTFIASQVVPGGECGEFENYLTFPDTSDRLCLMPNFAQGECYAIPQSAGGSLVDFKEVDCNADAVRTPWSTSSRRPATAPSNAPKAGQSRLREAGTARLLPGLVVRRLTSPPSIGPSRAVPGGVVQLSDAATHCGRRARSRGVRLRPPARGG